MKRVFPWLITLLLFVAFVASFTELQRMRRRFGEVTRHQFHDHVEVRQFMIRAALDATREPIVVLGDSITEMARLPEAACGHEIVNAGVGGAPISEFEQLAPRLLADHSPFLIVIALGANDVGSSRAGADYKRLVDALRHFSTRLVGVSVAPDAGTTAQIRKAAADSKILFVEPDLPSSSRFDGIHLNAAGYAQWTPAVMKAIFSECSPS
jgi:lysophospholipase L1-like esterase